MEDVIQIKKDNILKVKIIDEFGEDTGNHLEFDLEDIELPLRINEANKEHEKNERYFKTQKLLIDKRQDKKGKYLLSKNQEDLIKLYNEYYEREIKVLDSFLGDGGTKKLLNGRKPYATMFDDIAEYLKPILPKLEKTKEQIQTKIKEKYGATDEDILK